MTDPDKVKRQAEEANFILRSQVFNDAFTHIHDAIIKKWETSEDKQDRLDAWHELRCLKGVERDLRAYITNQTLAVSRRRKN